VFYSPAMGCWIARAPTVVIEGKATRPRVRAATEEGARQALDRLMRTHGLGLSSPSRMTLDEYLSGWLDGHAPTVRASTLRSYRTHVERHISPLLGGMVVAKIRPSDVRRLIADRLAAGKSPATVGRIVTTLHVALQRLVDEDRALPDNPADVRLPRVDRPPVAVLTSEGAERVQAALEGHWLEPLIRLLLGSGVRLGEALALDWRDVNLTAGYIAVRVSKTKVRAVPISDDAIAALTELRAKRTLVDDRLPVFVAPRTGKRLGGWSVSHAFPKILVAAGLPRMRVHDLRHGTASLMLAAGTPMRVISEQLGHANPAITAKTYAHVVPEQQRAAIRGIGSRIGSRTG
jgi:integrase